MKNRLSVLTKTLLIAALFFSLTASSASATNFYSDVPKTHPSSESIEFLTKNHITKGFSDGTFRPDSKMTRAEASKMIFNASKHLKIHYPLPPGKKARKIKVRDRKAGTFRDVSLAEKYPNRLIINGKPPRLVFPKRNITNAQFSRMIAEAFRLPKSTTTLQFTDVRSRSWYTPFIKSNVEAGILVNERTRFNPNKTMNRAAIADQLAAAMYYQMNLEPDIDTPIDDSGETPKPTPAP